MSKYTTEVRFICETYAGLSESVGYEDENKIIEQARSKVFSFEFPIFDESYRSVLETKILKHYYTREIGMETVGLWKHFLDMRMNEIMPYYNQLYNSTLLEIEPFRDVNYTRSGNRDSKHDETTTDTNTRTDNLKETTNSDVTRTDNLKSETDTNGTRTDNLHSTDTSWDRYSDTPQGALTNVQNNEYLTNARGIDAEGTNTGTVGTVGNSVTQDTGTVGTVGTGSRDNTGTQVNDGNGTRKYDNTDQYLESVVGKMNSSKSYSELLIEYRKTFLNIDMMIIDDLADLFFNLW